MIQPDSFLKTLIDFWNQVKRCVKLKVLLLVKQNNWSNFLLDNININLSETIYHTEKNAHPSNLYRISWQKLFFIMFWDWEKQEQNVSGIVKS